MVGSSAIMLKTITAQMLEGMDWENNRSAIAQLISQMLPIESLVPDVYEDWRPVVRDAVAFVAAHLSRERLVPKLIEQAQLPPDHPLEKRLIILIERMPSLQKIGQTLARNRNLDPEFRTELSRLENGIHDVAVGDIRGAIEKELGSRFSEYAIEIDREILAEASVSAVIGFSWLDPGIGRRREGVFKVLKPYVAADFSEELEILSGLAQYFDSHRAEYGLSEVKLSKVFEDVRRLLEKEVQFTNEQTNLKSAARRYAKVSGVRVPRLIEELSTPVCTAMGVERGEKITEVFRATSELDHRRKVATRLIEALVAIPLLSPRPDSVFHADPHAGNLFVDPRTQDLLLFDWALTESLSRSERRAILLLITAVTLRDKRLITRAVAKLGEGEVSTMNKEVQRFVGGLSPLSIAGVTDALTLVDRLIHAGIEFSSSLVIYRKMLFTLDGVLNDVMPGMRMDPTLAWYVTRQRANSSPGMTRLTQAEAVKFDFPLSRFDQLIAAWSAQFFLIRTAMQTGRQIRRFGFRKLRKLVTGVARPR